MKNFVFGLLASLMVSGPVFADDLPYRLPITRDGVTKTRVASNFWSGEYPYPVIDVKKMTTVAAYKSLRTLDEPVACTVKAGIYHPWSDTENSVILYYTLSGITTYKVTTSGFNTEVDLLGGESTGLYLEAGDLITNIVYASEGWCIGTRVDTTGAKQGVYLMCDGAPEQMEVVEENWKYGEQWVYLQCAEGHKAFIQDKTFLKQPNVKEGKIGGYGTVFPAD